MPALCSSHICSLSGTTSMDLRFFLRGSFVALSSFRDTFFASDDAAPAWVRAASVIVQNRNRQEQ